jgi:hypothetical protein
MRREYVVTVPVHGYVNYIVEARSAVEAKAKVNRQGAGDNEDFEITWVGRAGEVRETENSKAERGAS